MSDLLDNLAKLRDSLNADDAKMFSDSQFAYIYYKADRYLKVGPKQYSEKDDYHMPRPDWGDKGFETIRLGCNQVLMGIGFTPENPFKNLGVIGFQLLFSLFYFNVTEV